MGKLSDALERQRNEREIKAKMLQPAPSIQKPETNIRDTFDPKMFVLSAPGSLEAENFKILKGQILFSKNETKPRTIMVTSAFPGEGKTFTAANLAASISQGINEYALLVDCDFRKPYLHKMLGYSNNVGLQEYLTGQSDLPELLIQTRTNKLTLLTAGMPTANASEILSSNMMKDLFEEFKARYQDRYIIIDTSPAHQVSEVNVLANYVDGIILVVRAGHTPKEIIKKCIENLGENKILGIVFNAYDSAQNSYDKYYKNYLE